MYARDGVARFFPEQWERFRAVVPAAERDGDLVEAYARLLNDPDPEVRQTAADAGVTWEMSYLTLRPGPPLSGRFAAHRYRMVFARVVTHYFRHDCWLEEGQVLRDASVLANIPGTMVHGRLDLGSPLLAAWEMKQVWPGAELVVVDDSGHASDEPGMTRALVNATDHFATS